MSNFEIISCSDVVPGSSNEDDDGESDDDSDLDEGYTSDYDEMDEQEAMGLVLKYGHQLWYCYVWEANHVLLTN